MKTRIGSAAFLVACLLIAPVAPHGLASGGEAPATTANAEVVPNAEIQDGIRRVARADDEAELASALDRLRRSSAPDFSDLVPQLALFLLTADGEREGMTPAVIVSRLGVTHDQIEHAVAPHLGTASPALRAQLENLRGRDDEQR